MGAAYAQCPNFLGQLQTRLQQRVWQDGLVGCGTQSCSCPNRFRVAMFTTLS